MSAKPKEKPAPLKRTKRGLTRAEFAAQNDYATKTRLAIRAQLATLQEDEILGDGEFRALCGVAQAGWRAVANEAEFVANQFQISNRDSRKGYVYYWAHEKTVEWAIVNVSRARRIVP